MPLKLVPDPEAATRDYRAYVPPPSPAYAANMAAEAAAKPAPEPDDDPTINWRLGPMARPWKEIT